MKNVTLRYMNMNLGFALVDIHIPKGDIFHYHPLRNVIYTGNNVLNMGNNFCAVLTAEFPVFIALQQLFKTRQTNDLWK